MTELHSTNKRFFSGPEKLTSTEPLSSSKPQDDFVAVSANVTGTASANKKSSSAVSFSCTFCSKIYKHSRSLKIHFQNIHPTERLNLKEAKISSKVPSTFKFKCDLCSRNFNYKKHLLYHERKVHNKSTPTFSTGHKCTLCGAVLPRKEMVEHYEVSHALDIQIEEFEMTSFDDFLRWKDIIEKESSSKFRQECSNKTSACSVRHYYICHRSGNYLTKRKGMRRIKMQGSHKINGFCPASIKVIEKDGKCIIHFIKTHIGHKNELEHLNMTSAERETIALKLQAMVPFDTILNEIRDTISDDSLTRLHLLTKKDLYNIERSYNLSSNAIRHKNDNISLEMWAKEMQECRNSCILLFKPANVVLGEYPYLKNEDFILVIMNDAQCDMLTKFGSDVVCMDSTHDLKNCQLITLSIIDDMRQGFPCSFLISNRCDQEMLAIFLNAIKEKVGVITPNVFMTDISEAFINAWEEIMDSPGTILFCTWHVDREWRKNLIKIDSKEKQVEVYKTLRMLLEEQCSEEFSKILNNVIHEWSETPEMKEFYEYFTNHYTGNVTAWACCYRLQSGLNTNMHLERLHKTVKYLYVQGKRIKSLDKAVNSIMSFIRDKLVDRITASNNGKIINKLKDVKRKHRISEALNLSMVSPFENGWNISTIKGNEFYFIEQVKSVCDCKIHCLDCDACFHMYICSCADSSVKWNMCKHVHLLCRYLKHQKIIENEDEYSHDVFENTDSICESEQAAVHLSLNVNTSSSLDVEKEILREEFSKLVDSISNIDDIKTVKKHLLSMRTSFLASS